MRKCPEARQVAETGEIFLSQDEEEPSQIQEVKLQAPERQASRTAEAW